MISNQTRIRLSATLFHFFAFIGALLSFTISSAQAQSFPALSGRVVDAANIIPPDQEAALDAKLKALEDTTDRQLVVATIPSLEGYPIDDYGYRLGRAWGIGQKIGRAHV